MYTQEQTYEIIGTQGNNYAMKNPAKIDNYITVKKIYVSPTRPLKFDV